MENMVILGNGCAGSTAAIYAARANLKPIVFEGNEPGGQLTLTTEVENFPGFENGIEGPELVAIMKKQAQRFGADYRAGRCTKVEGTKGGYKVEIDGKDHIETKTLIIATGASARWLGLESEQKYKGRGVSTCATCDAFFYKGKPEVLIIGGGDSACEEAMVLAKFADHVSIVVRKDEMRASKIMQDKVKKHENIDIIWNTVVEEVLGDGTLLNGAKLKNTKTGEVKDHPCNGIFLAIGHISNTGFIKGLIDLDDNGYIIANNTKTNKPGVFAAGDVQDTTYRQAITAAGSGCQAALEAERFIEDSED